MSVAKAGITKSSAAKTTEKSFRIAANASTARREKPRSRLPVAAEVLVAGSSDVDDSVFDFRKSIENPVEIVAAQGEADAGLRRVDTDCPRRVLEKRDLAEEIAFAKHSDFVRTLSIGVCLDDAGAAANKSVYAFARIA